jgi:hypothetical protein
MSLRSLPSFAPNALFAALLALSPPAQAALVISQVYGGGGNSGATLSHDFVELRNTGSSPVSLGGLSLQYAGSTGSNWSKVDLIGTVPANGFFLVRLQTSNASVGAPLTQYDQSSTSINMSGTAGKIALVNSTALISAGTVCPSANLLDLVGFGSATNCAEASQPTPNLSAVLAALRADAGCTDTNNNGVDFTAATPAPRTSSTTTTACGGGSGGGGGGGGDGGGGGSTASATYLVQGSGATSPLVGQLVTVPGVITKINNNGFFLQDPVGDGNPATSDGLFVFTGSTTYPAVAVGNAVQVAGTVAEFSTGGGSVTQLSTVTAVTLTGTGQSITPTTVAFPEVTDGDLEKVEGMLVRIEGPFTIGQNAYQARYGQLTVSVGGRLENPTNRYAYNTPERAQLEDSNARRRLILDDGSSLQNPSSTPYLGAGALPRAGDQISGALVGVIDYGPRTTSSTPGDYRLHPTVAPTFAVANPRSSVPDAVGGNIKVASFNVLNYFTTFTNGQTAGGLSGQGCSEGSSVNAGNCRGADNAAEFERQRTKIIDALYRIDADAVGLMELQNNGNVAAQNLVDGLNARYGSSVYAIAPLPANTGTDAIRTAVIYKPSRMTAGTPVTDTAAINDRPTLLQPLTLHNGERLTVVVNHLKSKGGCGSTDTDQGQGCWNLKRTQQAQQLRSFVAAQASISGDRVLLLGDFNAYAKEDPILDLVNNGFADQVERFHPGAYSYVFDGQAGRLDHMLTSSTLSTKVVGAAHWHINADEQPNADYNLELKAPLTCSGGAVCPPDLYSAGPYRSSDHDPVLVGLNLVKPYALPSSGAVTGTAGDDEFSANSLSRSVVSSGDGFDRFVFGASYTGGVTVTDFNPAKDVISLRATLNALGVSSTTPWTSGHIGCRSSGADAIVTIDTDAAGPALPRSMLLLKTLSCSQLGDVNFVN